MFYGRNYHDDFIRFDDRRTVLTNQLYRQYENFLHQHRLTMRPCVIEIVPILAHWGDWNSETRTIRLSQKLIDTYAWTTVLEVLKHEMAHQYVTEVYGLTDRHGGAFKSACEVLGVAPWARAASGALPDEIPSWQAAELSEETKRHLDRVNKLLSLASSANEHEAALAMQRAQEILTKHRLERAQKAQQAQQTQGAGCDYWFVPLRTKRIDATTKVIFSILRSFYFVKPITIEYFDAVDLQAYKAYDVCGNTEDLRMAEYVYEFLKRTVESLWKDHQRQTRAKGAVKRSYCLGVLRGFQQKLTESQAKMKLAPESQALVVRESKALDSFLSARYPRLVKGGGIAGARDRDSFAAGVDDGKKIVLNKPISARDGFKGRLLS